MPTIFVHASFFFFTLVALSGVWMRLQFLHPVPFLPYTNILHGHSHLAILGWAFLGAFFLFLTYYWRTLKQKKQGIILFFLLMIVSVLMFISFLYQGYGLFSIIFSTTHIFLEYWTSLFIYQQIKIEGNELKSEKLFIFSSLFFLVLSSLGPFALGYISAIGQKESYWFDMAMYFYLHFQYNGWLTLFLIGMFILICKKQSIRLEDRLLEIGFWIYVLSLFPGYFLSVLWVDLGNLMIFLAILGSIGQWIGVIFILLAFLKSWKDISSQYATLISVILALTFLFLFIKSTTELGLIIPDLSILIYETRSIVIGYLHLTLLGFVSIFILAQNFMLKILPVKRLSIKGMILLIIGFLLNELLLFGQGLLEWTTRERIPYLNEGLFLASGLLLLGIIILWMTITRQKCYR
ncbi:hypothetical protein [Calidifontibacillus erzurumensis]|uniref:Uncharacterized protein n=1 Tax=Calidifontibacillus erzurumensis TaxID=2741433 RepID=A0A8J8GFP4_9BACI|nr:hypothetical protein [Calidifontibacillus erzurumensis]NSL50938.1 hypothetical protein [Calidifontibacillus erzurumensis]